MIERYDSLGRTDVEIVEDFAEAKGLPKVGRLVGAARLHHRLPEAVKVITGRPITYERHALGEMAVDALVASPDQ